MCEHTFVTRTQYTRSDAKPEMWKDKKTGKMQFGFMMYDKCSTCGFEQNRRREVDAELTIRYAGIWDNVFQNV